MSGGISVSSSPPLTSRILPSNSTSFGNPAAWAAPLPRRPLRSSYVTVAVKLNSRTASSFVCNSNSSPPPAGENDSKRVLDAFFLGKALAESINERVESAVGEFLSTVGRFQAEQQKQVQDFQDEVLEKAKRAKEKAAREALEAQGGISKSPSANITTYNNGVASKTTPPSSPPSLSNSSAPTTNKDVSFTDTDPLSGISIDD